MADPNHAHHSITMAISATASAVRSRAGAGASSGSSWLSDGVAPAPAVTRSDKEDAVEAGLEAHSSLPLQVGVMRTLSVQYAT